MTTEIGETTEKVRTSYFFLRLNIAVGKIREVIVEIEPGTH